MTAVAPTEPRSPFWRTTLFVIAAGCFLALLSFGLRSSFGLFLDPMSSAFGWGREVFAIAIALQNLLWGLAQPVAGAFADRYGSGRVLTIGALIYAAGLFIMANASTPGMLTLSAGVLVGLGVAGASFAIVLAAFTRRVSPEKRSWALGIGTAAGSAGQFFVVPLGQSFISAYGWSMALTIFGFMALLMVPCAAALTGRPDTRHEAKQSIRAALGEAFAHPSYNYLTAGFFVCGFHVAFIQTHLPAYITDMGLPAGLAAWALALVGGGNIIGAYTSGVLGGRFSKKYLLSALYFARAVVIALFILLPISEASVLVFSLAIGLLWLSTVPLTSGLVAQFFGTQHMAMLFGIVFFSHQVGAFLGVWMGGYLFDQTGSYDVVWWISIALGLLAAAVHWPIREQGVARLAQAG
ncbi:MFS transporter [Pelagibius sp.]|uniref:MFS transporter n=1 Tax=Pelagibius sp. TaxID=1931238 RepID=UPI00262EBADB|nr:MFS transporter [Pelagibius sp.]